MTIRLKTKNRNYFYFPNLSVFFIIILYYKEILKGNYISIKIEKICDGQIFILLNSTLFLLIVHSFIRCFPVFCFLKPFPSYLLKDYDNGWAVLFVFLILYLALTLQGSFNPYLTKPNLQVASKGQTCKKLVQK